MGHIVPLIQARPPPPQVYCRFAMVRLRFAAFFFAVRRSHTCASMVNLVGIKPTECRHPFGLYWLPDPLRILAFCVSNSASVMTPFLRKSSNFSSWVYTSGCLDVTSLFSTLTVAFSSF